MNVSSKFQAIIPTKKCNALLVFTEVRFNCATTPTLIHTITSSSSTNVRDCETHLTLLKVISRSTTQHDITMYIHICHDKLAW